MEHQLWKMIVTIITTYCKRVKPAAFCFSDADIVKVWYWAVIHDRPVSWACRHVNWPPHLRKRPLPSDTTMSRRLRSASVLALQKQVEQHVIAPKQAELLWIIDGKSLPIGGCSRDRQAGYGRAAGCKARGYKVHVIYSPQDSIAAWRLAPMNQDERVIAERMLKSAPVQGYALADGNYDSNRLHQLCQARGNLQLITPRRYGPTKGMGHRRQTAGRLRSKAILEDPFPQFGQQLMKQRADIERAFGNLTNWAGGLSGLPAWVRTHRRVHRWVQAKLILTSLKPRLQLRTYVA
jgi:hypothetical protein